MKLIKTTINGLDIEVPPDSTILEVAKTLNIHIPTLCHLNGSERFTSCMICVVHEKATDKLIPSCSAPVADEMIIETDDEKVREARRDALDFLLSEHVGDCDAPCQRACPAHMDIPLMIRQIEENKLADAIITVKKDIALPAVLGRICPAPCEKGCNRKYYDSPVSMCLLKRYVADSDLAQDIPYEPAVKKSSGKKVAIIGSGPTGLSSAFYLLQNGHDCYIFDQNPDPGGMLRYGVTDDRLPKSVLNSEIERISELGAQFKMQTALGRDFSLDELRSEYDAAIIALGKIESAVFKGSKLELSVRGIMINRETFETAVPGVFAGGNALAESQMAIRSCAHGKEIAYSINQFLNKEKVTGIPRRFNSMMGKLNDDEASEFLKEAADHKRIEPQGVYQSGFSDPEAQKESARCFRCDCRKSDSCKLRDYAEDFGASQRRFKLEGHRTFQKIIQHDQVIYEPGKCIKCGLCVQITKNAGEKLGLTFINRGFNVRVETPFEEPLSEGLKKTARECVEACPTAALSWRAR